MASPAAGDWRAGPRCSDSEEEAPAVNPAPPCDEAADSAVLEAVLHSDAIGDTLYSERGVLRTLMALNAAVPRYLRADRQPGDGEAGQEEDGQRGHEDDGQGGQEEQQLMELDPELEEQLCQLWDMTAERAVAEFAARSGLLDVAWPLLAGRSPCPRLLEVLAGAVANCAGHGAVALPGGADTAAAAVGLLLSASRGDAPVLRETLRLAAAAARAQPHPAPLLRALAGWLPLLTEILQSALSAPLLCQALTLLQEVAEVPDQRDWWLSELAAVPALPGAVLEGAAQLTSASASSGGGSYNTVSAREALDCCRDALVLLAQVEAVDGATRPESDAWLSPTPRLVSGVCAARRAAGAGADARLACCLLWLAAPALRREWSDATLAALLRFCEAARRLSGDEDLPEPGDERPEDITEGSAEERPEDIADQQEQEQVELEDEEGAEERAQLAERLDATAAYLARQCAADVARFVVCSDWRREAGLMMTALEHADPELACSLRVTPPADADTHRL